LYQFKHVISKVFKADLAHIVESQFLPEDFHCKCRFIHGHTVHIEAFIASNALQPNRMVLDYSLLQHFKHFIDIFLDHCLILPKETKFPYEKLLELYDEFYEKAFGVDRTWNDYVGKTIVFGYKGKDLAKRMSTVSLFDVESTTAEDMSKFLRTALAITLQQTSEYYPDLDFIEDLYVAINFKETASTNAWSSFKQVKDILQEVING